ncbi:Thioredoxin-like 3-3 [Chlorella vulgaris]
MADNGAALQQRGGWRSLRSPFQQPQERFAAAGDRPQPVRKAHVAKLTPNMTGVRTDEQLSQLLQRSRNDTVLVNFGSSWCAHCHKMFPAFVSLSKQYPRLRYALAQARMGWGVARRHRHSCADLFPSAAGSSIQQVDYMHEGVRGITCTPTFAVYRQGKKVDQFFGANPQQLQDRIWLHSQDVGQPS